MTGGNVAIPHFSSMPSICLPDGSLEGPVQDGDSQLPNDTGAFIDGSRKQPQPDPEIIVQILGKGLNQGLNYCPQVGGEVAEVEFGHGCGDDRYVLFFEGRVDIFDITEVAEVAMTEELNQGLNYDPHVGGEVPETQPGHGVGDDPNVIFFEGRVDVFALTEELNQGNNYRPPNGWGPVPGR